ncbi:MAG TPA: serine hydrolase [Oligoflexus sp.]|uniref:serine hydrolase domain-containing protein n=1 Tax=Oligoflexus sp. TaxID=1971216 RepID=UPI002D2C79FA|nr:serine hydrolase [Oligoflexus sp.]HYX38330.1 serine hydrolase [Oligoflexus sp.]
MISHFKFMISGVRLNLALFCILKLSLLTGCSDDGGEDEEECSLPSSIDFPSEKPKQIIQRPFQERAEAAFVQIEKLNLTGLAAIKFSNDLIIREFGTAASDNIPGLSTQFDINSVTKTITGLAVLKLFHLGLALPTTNLSQIFPNVPDDKASITIEQLANHTSGFPASIGSDFEKISRIDFVKRAFETGLLAVPGSKYRYSNTGYSILAAAIEILSKKTYEEFLTETILSPLGISSTGYMKAYNEINSLKADDGRTIFEVSWGGQDPGWNLVGNGGLVSTIEDLVAIREAVSSRKLVLGDWQNYWSQRLVREHPLGYSYYSYGHTIHDIPDVGAIYWHDGGNSVNSAKWSEIPDQGTMLITAGNIRSGCSASTMMSLLQLHLFGIAAE